MRFRRACEVVVGERDTVNFGCGFDGVCGGVCLASFGVRGMFTTIYLFLGKAKGWGFRVGDVIEPYKACGIGFSNHAGLERRYFSWQELNSSN